MIRAIRGQPNRGLRDFSSTMALISAWSGPVGPDFFAQRVDENRRQYLSDGAPAYERDEAR